MSGIQLGAMQSVLDTHPVGVNYTGADIVEGPKEALREIERT